MTAGRSGSGFRTPHSIELSRLTDQLGALHDHQAGGTDWCEGIIGAYLSTAHIWPLEISWHEMFLEFAGLDLADTDDLSNAVAMTQILIGTGACEFDCTDSVEFSPLWERVQRGEKEDLQEAGAHIVNTDNAIWFLRLRRRRAAQAIRRCQAA